MWKRLTRIFRALFGWMIRGAEDPELILRQLQDDLRAKIPEMNRQVAEIVKYEKQLQMQYDRKAQQVAKYLGPVRFSAETRARTSTPGVVTGLAWTQVGGDILFVEATAMKGKDRLILTGSESVWMVHETATANDAEDLEILKQ